MYQSTLYKIKKEPINIIPFSLTNNRSMAPKKKKKKKKNLQKKTNQLNYLLHFGTVREREKRLKRAPEPLKIEET